MIFVQTVKESDKLKRLCIPHICFGDLTNDEFIDRLREHYKYWNLKLVD